jgi:uncharacterized protein YidB (DUF937 family)
MSLFDQVLGAIANPAQSASTNQLGTILTAAQALGSQHGVDPGAAQTILSIVGNYAQSSLQQQHQANPGQAEAIVNQFSGTNPNAQAVQALFTPEIQAQVAQEIAQRTGIDQQQVQSFLPMIVPLVLNLLQMGNNPSTGTNSTLNSFLDADGSGSVDIGDAMQLAAKFMSQPR